MGTKTDRRKKGTGSIFHSTDPSRKKAWGFSYQDFKGKTHTKFFVTEKDAKAFAKQLASDEKLRNEIFKGGLSYQTYAEIWLKTKTALDLKNSTLQRYKRDIQLTIRYLPIAVKLDEINSTTLQEMMNDAAGKGHAKATIKKMKEMVIRIVTDAVAEKQIPSLPVFRVDMPKTKSRQPNSQTHNLGADHDAETNYYNDHEIALYTEECRKPDSYPKKYAGKLLEENPNGYKLLFILHTGLRLGEALALTWDDFDEASKTLTINKDVSYTKNLSTGKYECIVQPPKTENSKRVIVLNSAAYSDLLVLKSIFGLQTQELQRLKEEALQKLPPHITEEERRKMAQDTGKKFGKYLAEHNYICGSTSFPFGLATPSGIEGTHRKIRDKVPSRYHVSIHGLRHTYVTHYYLTHKNDADFDLATFSRSLGHKSVRTTMEIYCHLRMEENKHIMRNKEELKDF